MGGYDVLLLDEGSHLFRKLGWVLAYKGHRVTRAAGAQVFLEALKSRSFDLLISRLTMARPETLEVLQEAKRLNPESEIMVLSGEYDLGFPLAAYQMEIDEYLFMPCSPKALWRRVAACLERLERKGREPSSGTGAVNINQRVLKKLLHMFQYVQHSLNSLTQDLEHLTRDTVRQVDENLRKKMQKISARMEVLLDLTQGFPHKLPEVETG